MSEEKAMTIAENADGGSLMGFFSINENHTIYRRMIGAALVGKKSCRIC